MKTEIIVYGEKILNSKYHCYLLWWHRQTDTQWRGRVNNVHHSAIQMGFKTKTNSFMLSESLHIINQINCSNTNRPESLNN